MSVRKIGENKFQIDYYPEGRKGKRIIRVFYGTEVEANAEELFLRRAASGSTRLRNPKIIDVFNEYIEHKKLRGSAETIKDIIINTKKMRPFFFNLTVNHMTDTVIQQYQRKRQADGVKNRTINKEMSYLNSIVSFMERRGYCLKRQYNYEKLPEQPPTPRIPSPENLRKFIAAIKREDVRMMAVIMLNTGMRWKEVRLLRWENLQLDKGLIWIVETKGNKVERQAFLPDSVVKYLADRAEDEGYIFLSTLTGKPYTTVKDSFRNASARSGVKINPHLLRHCFGTYTLSVSQDLRQVQVLMGHTNISTTTRYTQLQPEVHRETMKKLGSIFEE